MPQFYFSAFLGSARLAWLGHCRRRFVKIMENRVITIGIGVFFATLGVLIALTAENGALSYLAAVSVGGLGVEAIYSAIKNRRSLISRIGPLP